MQLTTKRPYKKACSVEDAVALIYDNAGAHIDPELVKLFHPVLLDTLSVKRKYADEGVRYLSHLIDE